MTDTHLYLNQGGLRFALPMADVEAVVQNGVYAPVACGRPRWWGVCFRAGRLYPVVSLGGGPAAPVGVLCRQGGLSAVFFADEVEGLQPLPPEAEWEPAEGLGLVWRNGLQPLWLPQLKELAVSGAC